MGKRTKFKQRIKRNLMKGRGRRGIIDAYIPYKIRKEEADQAIKESKLKEKRDE